MSNSENPIIGSGEFIYECHHNWDRQDLPVGYEYGNASHGIAFDSQGFCSLRISMCGGEFLLVPDLHARLTILNGQNEVVVQLGDDETWRHAVLADNFAMRGQPEQWRPGCFVHPHDARFDAEGNIYVAEWVRTGRITKLVRKT